MGGRATGGRPFRTRVALRRSIVTAGLVMAAIAGLAQAATSWTPRVSGETACMTEGDHLVTWTIGNSQSDAAMTIVSATARARSPSMSVTTTRAPLPASETAEARPMPLPAPVTTATAVERSTKEVTARRKVEVGAPRSSDYWLASKEGPWSARRPSRRTGT